MSDTAIRVENLSKRYRIGLGDELPDTLGGAVTQAVKRPLRNWRRLRRLTDFDDGAKGDDGRQTNDDDASPIARPERGRRIHRPSSDVRTDVDRDTLWALKDVSFQVERGEVVGIIGRNGAGKSTLLKILSRITAPTEGRAVINGRVGSLLEVGTGFHPELTGRENIYLNGTILGMSKAEVDRKFDKIVDFSGVEKFIDTPVKRYSSGMRVRLAFSVAAHLEPDILLIDEVLAVGDAEFQQRCLGKMGEVASEGRTVLFVSHNMAAVSSLCPKAMYLHQGRLLEYGPTDEIIEHYVASAQDLMAVPLVEREDRDGTEDLKFRSVWCVNQEGQRSLSLRTGEQARIELVFDTKLPPESIPDLTLSFSFLSQYGHRLLLCRNDYTGDEFAAGSQANKAVCLIPDFPLVPGIYHLNVYAECKGDILDWVKHAVQIEVLEGDFFGTGRLPPRSYGTVLVRQKWFLG